MYMKKYEEKHFYRAVGDPLHRIAFDLKSDLLDPSFHKNGD